MVRLLSLFFEENEGRSVENETKECLGNKDFVCFLIFVKIRYSTLSIIS